MSTTPNVSSWYARLAEADIDDNSPSDTGIFVSIRSPGDSVLDQATKLTIQIRDYPGCPRQGDRLEEHSWDLRPADFRRLVACLTAAIEMAEGNGILPAEESVLAERAS